ncbi:MAG: flagellar basal body protein FliL [Methylococcaceae bacterium]|nr:MAG: flagellar basal body protein FliL [Methylococcaceae bacterium]
MSKAAKPDAAKPGAEAAGAQPKKGKKKLIIIITAVVLLVGGGAAAFLLLNPAEPTSHDEAATAKAEEEARAKNPPKFVDLGTFTANLVREDGDRFLQIAISLKITKPELEEKIKASSPEILHHVNMVLQSKRPSDINTFEGKQELAEQIKGQVEYVLGMRKAPPAIHPEQAAGAAPPGARKIRSDIAEVLFTSFIIQ